MQRRTALHRLCAWALMALLLLKAAAPGLAAAAANARGLALVEVCTLYGLRTVAVDAQGVPVEAALPHFPSSPDSPLQAAADGCALATMPAFDLPGSCAWQATALSPSACPPSQAHIRLLPPDASRAWWAGLKQAPPTA